MNQSKYDVAVIGGGIAGLTVTWRLLQAGTKAICLEADSVAGGSVRTDRIGAYLCERGAQNILEEPNGPVMRLARDLGIDRAVEPAREQGNFIASKGRLFAMPSGLPQMLSLKGILRAGRGLVARCEPGGREESIAAWVRRRFGDEFARRVADPMVCGIYAGDPERLSLDATFPAVRGLERSHSRLVAGMFRSRPVKRNVYSFRNGMGTLTESLAGKLGPALRRRAKVAGITTGENGRYRIEGCEGVEASGVILATAAGVAAGLVKRVAPTAAQLLGSIRNAPVVSASLVFSTRDFDRPAPRGYGLVGLHCEGSRLLGCLFSSSAFEKSSPAGTVLLRIIAGGDRDPAVCSLSDEELTDLAIQELALNLGIKSGAQPVFFHAVHHHPGLPQYEMGHLAQVEAIEKVLASVPGIYITGNSYRGLSVSKVVEQAERLSESLLRIAAAA
jgi:protoporphyrinogen/coproporphyrinogen III oxidase